MPRIRMVHLSDTGALATLTSTQSRQYHFVSTALNWTQAQSFCRQTYSDLATIEDTADLEAVANTTSNYTGKAWIGLYDDLVNSWKWSLNDSDFYGEGETEFRNWFTGQPDNRAGEEYCVMLMPNYNWTDTKCSTPLPFVCYNGTVNGAATFVKISSDKNWTEAQRYCRENHIDLASVRNQSENDIIKPLAGSSPVWIGLYREKVWSDGSTSLFQHWEDGQPDNPTSNEYCVASSFGGSGRWSDENCANSLPFICYGEFQNQQFIGLDFNIPSPTQPVCDMADIISAQLRVELIRRGLPADFNLEVTIV